MEIEKKRKFALKGHGTALLILAFAAAVFYYFAHPQLLSEDYQGLPGIGFTISQWALLAGALLAAFREDKRRLIRNPAGYFLLGCALLLGACYGIFANQAMRLMNLPVMVLVSAQAIFAFSGHHGEKPLEGWGWLVALGRIFSLPFRYFIRPFEALAERSRLRQKKMKGLGIGIAIGVPVLMLAVSLLSSADAMFSDAFASALQWMDGGFLWHLNLSLLGGLLLFSFLFGASMTWRQAKPAKACRAPAATFVLALSGLAIVYALFAYIQFRYLFGGVEAAVMQGGYAEYARTGFFQLVALACVTLALLLPGLSLCGESRAVRFLGAVVAGLTVVIDVSAFFRMSMYIRAYGLTVLRVVTLWGMLAILIALILALVKCIYPAFRLCPCLTAALLVTWIGLNYMNMDGRIAEYNVAAWNRGQLSHLDAQYLAKLSPHVLPALEKIEDEELRNAVLQETEKILEGNCPAAAYDWSFAWSSVEQPMLVLEE